MNKTLQYGSPLSTSTLFYRVEGQGFPVLLVHGFAEDNRIWDNQVDYLKDRYRLFIPDLPGCGRSSPIQVKNSQTGAETSMEELADLIKAILDAENTGPCILIGHSMGGYIALAFAEKYPGQLVALGFFHSTAYADTPEKITARRKGIEFIRKNGSAPFIRQSIPNLFAEASRKRQEDIITALIDRYSGFNPDSLVAYYEAMIYRPDRTTVLREFPGPVLFIIGEGDNSVPLDHSLRQSHMPGLAFIHILTHAGHMGMLEESTASNLFLDDFLQPTLKGQ
ncbi:alpha/beta fold hydrolase [Flavitalea flava]